MRRLRPSFREITPRTARSATMINTASHCERVYANGFPHARDYISTVALEEEQVIQRIGVCFVI